MKNVLLTGCSGFLGRYIEQALLQNGCSITGVGRGQANSIVCDLAVQEPSFGCNFDWVVHAMGKAHIVPGNEEEAKDFFEVNVRGTQNLCSALEKLPVMPTRFVFISTVAVYGLEEGMLVDEQAKLLGHTPYAKSKIEAEQWLEHWCEQQGIELVVFRLPLVAGANPPGNLGAMIKGIKTGRYFNIDGGKARKSVVLAADVANAIIQTEGVCGTFNLNDGCHPSFAELASVIADQLGKSTPFNIPSWLALPAAFAGDFLGAKAPLNSHKLQKITANLTFSDRLARERFGWNPRPVLKDFKIA